MTKYLRFIPPLVLIIFGAILEIYYYWYRFHGDGINDIFAVVAGVVLTVFLIVVSQYKKPGARILAGFLIAYSIFCTSAGQAYSLEQVRLQQSVERSRQDEMDRERERLSATIETLTNRWYEIERQKNEQIQSFEDRFGWRNTLALSEESQREIQDEIDRYNAQLEESYSTGDILPPDIYNYYGETLGVSALFLQVLLQMLLSAFIALMAPIGVAIWPKLPKTKKLKIERPVKQKRVPLEIIERWVQINWMSLRNDRGNKIISKKSFVEFVNARGELDILDMYDRIHTTAIGIGVITAEGIISEVRESEAVKRIASEI